MLYSESNLSANTIAGKIEYRHTASIEFMAGIRYHNLAHQHVALTGFANYAVDEKGGLNELTSRYVTPASIRQRDFGASSNLHAP